MLDCLAVHPGDRPDHLIRTSGVNIRHREAARGVRITRGEWPLGLKFWIRAAVLLCDRGIGPLIRNDHRRIIGAVDGDHHILCARCTPVIGHGNRESLRDGFRVVKRLNRFGGVIQREGPIARSIYRKTAVNPFNSQGICLCLASHGISPSAPDQIDRCILGIHIIRAQRAGCGGRWRVDGFVLGVDACLLDRANVLPFAKADHRRVIRARDVDGQRRACLIA